MTNEILISISFQFLASHSPAVPGAYYNHRHKKKDGPGLLLDPSFVSTATNGGAGGWWTNVRPVRSHGVKVPSSSCLLARDSGFSFLLILSRIRKRGSEGGRLVQFLDMHAV